MVIENDPSARMQVRSRGELQHPGSCMVCGSGTCDNGYLDLGVFFDFEGTCYLCMTCAFQAGETIGLYTPEEVKHSQQLIQRLTTENAAMTQELEYARPIVSLFESVSRSFANSGDVADPVADPLTVTESEIDVLITPGSSLGGATSAEPVKGSGRANTGRAKSRNFTAGEDGSPVL